MFSPQLIDQQFTWMVFFFDPITHTFDPMI